MFWLLLWNDNFDIFDGCLKVKTHSIISVLEIIYFLMDVIFVQQFRDYLSLNVQPELQILNGL